MIGLLCRSALAVLILTCADVSRAHGTLSTQMQELEAALLSGLPPYQRHSFTEAQSAWQVFKSTECRQRHLNYPAVTEFEECDREMDLERMNDLRRQLRWLHGLPGHIRSIC